MSDRVFLKALKRVRREPLELKFGILALLSAVIGFFLALATATRRDLVEVDFLENRTAAQQIASFGIYQAQVNTDNVDPALLRDIGLFLPGFEGNTVDFALLFPSQRNLVADLLPVDADFLLALSREFEEEEPLLTSTVISAIHEIRSLSFSTCRSYFARLRESLQELHVELQRFVFPRVSLSFSNLIASQLTDLVVQPLEDLLRRDPLQQLMRNLLQQAIQLSNEAANDCPVLSFTSTVNLQVAECLSEALADVQAESLTQLVVEGVSEYLQEDCLEVTIHQCLQEVVTVPLDTALTAGVRFEGLNLCNISAVCSENESKERFLSDLQAVLEEIGDAVGSGMLQNFFLLVDEFGLLPRRSTFADGVEKIAVPVPFPIRENVNYNTPCNYVSALAEVIGLDFFSPCVFGNYWERLSRLLSDELLKTSAAEIARIYQYCSESSNGLVTLCPSIISLALVDISFNRNIGIEQTALLQDDIFYRAAESLCQQDEEDRSIISSNQRVMSAALCFYISTVLLGVCALARKRERVIFFSLACLTSALSFILTISMLVSFQNAPFYSQVGILGPEEDPRKAQFSTGGVALVGTGAAFALFIAGLFFLIAALLSKKRQFKQSLLDNHVKTVAVEVEPTL